MEPDPDPECVTGAKLNGVLMDLTDVEVGDNDAIVGSVKFDDGAGEGTFYDFDSNRAPVYGHLAIKDGGGPETCMDAPAVDTANVVCSNGLLAGGDTMDVNDYVARPNGATVPEPGALLLLPTGMVGLGAIRRARACELRM